MNISIIKRYRKTISIALGLVILIVLFSIFKKDNKSTNSSGVQSIVEKNVPTVQIVKNFNFQAIDAEKEMHDVTLSVVQAELKSEVKVKGEARKPSSGNSFLLLRLEIDNKDPERVAFSSADHIRLEADGKKYAPDFHNGNVVIDPISVKKDLVAFIVPDSQKSFKFIIGELEGEKQELEVSF